jgi:hypothetical protein
VVREDLQVGGRSNTPENTTATMNAEVSYGHRRPTRSRSGLLLGDLVPERRAAAGCTQIVRSSSAIFAQKRRTSTRSSGWPLTLVCGPVRRGSRCRPLTVDVEAFSARRGAREGRR